MQLITAITFLSALGSAMAMPAAAEEADVDTGAVLDTRDSAPRIDFGVQKQDADGKNHWVVWKGGVGSVCSIYKVLDGSPCSEEWEIDGFRGKLHDCNDDDTPETLYGSGGTRIRQCKLSEHKISCAHTHDIIKLGDW